MRNKGDGGSRKMRPEVVVHDPSWITQYGYEKRRLASAFRGLRREFEHIGGTSIPDAASRPIIDIMLGLVRLRYLEKRIEPLARLGFSLVDSSGDSWQFVKHAPDGQLSHRLLVVVLGGSIWQRELAFRSALRADQLLVSEYSRLERELERRFRSDPDGESQERERFVDDVVGR